MRVETPVTPCAGFGFKNNFSRILLSDVPTGNGSCHGMTFFIGFKPVVRVVSQRGCHAGVCNQASTCLYLTLLQ